MNTFDTFSNPLNPGTARTLDRLFSVVGSMQVVLLGAFARDLVFYHIFGFEVPRATMDIDTCVQMASWEDFHAACAKLKAIGFTDDDPDHPEKMYDENGQEIDLLPFGSLSEDGRTITWPADDSPWTVSGIQEAHDHAWLVRVSNRELRVIPPCAMVYLKMLSTHDRPSARRKKDTQDINFVLSRYLDVMGRDRLRSDGGDADIMGLEAGSLPHVTARLAGRDIGSMVSSQTASVLDEIFRIETQSGTESPVARHLARYHEGQFQQARKILLSMRAGFDERRS